MRINKSIIEAKFKRAKLKANHTFLWDDLTNIKKDQILATIELDHDDTPIICYYESKFYKWIITTTKLIIFEDKATQAVYYSAIKEILLSKLINQDVTKKENDTIQCILLDGIHIELRVEKTTWHEIYNILRFIISKN